MISKRDWRRHVQKMWKLLNALESSGSNYSLTVNGEEVFMVDVINEKIYCRIKNGVDVNLIVDGYNYVHNPASYVVRTYKHPDSFRSGIGVNKVNGSVKLTYSHSGLNNIEKVIKTR